MSGNGALDEMKSNAQGKGLECWRKRGKHRRTWLQCGHTTRLAGTLGQWGEVPASFLSNRRMTIGNPFVFAPICGLFLVFLLNRPSLPIASFPSAPIWQTCVCLNGNHQDLLCDIDPTLHSTLLNDD